MSSGRPNTYRDIVKSLGGIAMVDEIYAYGLEHKLINCTRLSCEQAITINLRKGNLVGNLKEGIALPEMGWRPSARPTEKVPRIVQFWNRMNTQAKFALELEMRVEQRWADDNRRLNELERKVAQLEQLTRKLEATA